MTGAENAALVADLRALVKSWEVLRGGWEYGTAVLAVLQQHGYVTPPGSSEEGSQ